MAAAYTGTFTDTTLVKKESGFEENTNIDETNDVTSKVKAAEAEIFSCLAQLYVLPLSTNANFTGSTAEELLQETAKILASGFLMWQQFKGQGGDLEDLATSKMGEARSTLKKLKNGTIILLDTAFLELDTVDAGLNAISGFPDSEDDKDLTTDNENAKFTMDRQF